MRSKPSPGLSSQSQSAFTRLAKKTSWAVGRPAAFGAAAVLVIAWAATGPLFKFSDTWQLVINTSTTIATFLIVFLIQNTQNRDAEAIQIKLDELIRVTRGAHTALLDLEELEDKEIERLRANYEALAKTAREDLRKGKADTGSPEVRT